MVMYDHNLVILSFHFHYQLKTDR